MPYDFTKEELQALIEDVADKVSGESDLDWAEICAKYGDKISPETLRKAGVGLRLAMKAGVLTQRDVLLNALADAEDDGDIVTPAAIQRQLDDIYKAKRRLYDQRREYNKTLMAEARWEHLTEELLDVARGLPQLPRPTPGRKALSTDGEAVLLLSDWHYGMKTDNIWNRYNTDIFIERLGRLVESTIKYLQRHRPRVLHVVILGDALNGALRASSRVESEEATCEQLMHVSEYFADTVAELSGHVPEVQVHSTYGNHARTVQRYEDSIHADNMERIIPWWMKERLKGFENVTIADSSMYEFLYIPIFSFDFVAVHGDLDKSGTLAKTVNNVFQRAIGRTVDYAAMGHIHHTRSFEDAGVETIVAGSMCGTDEYANSKRLYSLPSQTLLFFNEEDGLECRYDIKFRDHMQAAA